MTNAVVVGLGFAGMVVLVASVFGAVERRERYPFVIGIALVLVGLSVLSGMAGGLVALLGFVLVVASTVPMLRE